MSAAAWAPASCAASGAPDAPHSMHPTDPAAMGVPPGKLVELGPGSGTWYVTCRWCPECKYFRLCPPACGAEDAREKMRGLSWRLSMRGSPMRKRNWACPECAPGYEWPDEDVSTTPAGGASSHAAPSAHAIEYDLLAGHPVFGGESSSPPAAVIDELQAEVQKLNEWGRSPN